MTAEFKATFEMLRAILQRHTGRLTVKDDTPTLFTLEGGSHPTHGTPMPVAWVKVGKAYVSFHHMGVYADPSIMAACSPALKARMQGKSCFNFTAPDAALFAELEKVTVRGFEVFRRLGLAGK